MNSLNALQFYIQNYFLFFIYFFFTVLLSTPFLVDFLYLYLYIVFLSLVVVVACVAL